MTEGPALLFCPADRPERYEKAAARSDTVILDLEDAVNPDAKAAARAHLAASAAGPGPDDRPRQPGRHGRPRRGPASRCGRRRTGRSCSPRRRPPPTSACWPGTTSSRWSRPPPAWRTRRRSPPQPNVVGLMWGAEDLVASLGGTSSRRPDGSYRDVAVHARSVVLRGRGRVRQGRDRRGAPGHRRRRRAGRRGVRRGGQRVHRDRVHPPVAGRRDPRGLPARRTRRSSGRAACSPPPWGSTGRSGGTGSLVDGPVLKHAEEVLRRAG